MFLMRGNKFGSKTYTFLTKAYKKTFKCCNPHTVLFKSSSYIIKIQMH